MLIIHITTSNPCYQMMPNNTHVVVDAKMANNPIIAIYQSHLFKHDDNSHFKIEVKDTPCLIAIAAEQLSAYCIIPLIF